MNTSMTRVLIPLYSGGPAPLPALICFPPAGSGASFFRPLVTLFRELGDQQPFSTVSAVQYPGRESRMCEPHALTCARLCAESASAIYEQSHSANGVVLLGHSFGARLAFDTAVQLAAMNRSIAGLIISGSGSQPPTPGNRRHPDPHTSSTEALLGWVRELGGLPTELLECDEILALAAAALRADLIAAEAPACPATAVIHQPLLLLSADSDPLVSPEEMDGWSTRTTADSSRLILHGGHHALLRDKSWLQPATAWINRMSIGAEAASTGWSHP